MATYNNSSNWYTDLYTTDPYTNVLDKIENGTIDFDIIENTFDKTYDSAWVHIVVHNKRDKALNIILDSFDVPKHLDTNERLCYYMLFSR